MTFAPYYEEGFDNLIGIMPSVLNCFENDEFTPCKRIIKQSNSDSDDLEIGEFIKREFEGNNNQQNSDFDDDDFDEKKRYELDKELLQRNFNKYNNINVDIHGSKSSNCNSSKIKNNEGHTDNENEENVNIEIDLRKKIFFIQKIPHETKKISEILKKKRGRDGKSSKKYNVDWDGIIVPKEKHFHFDRKKHRIVFQRKHLKVIYSIVDLSYPFNFIKCFNMIKEHIGDKTNKNYGTGKSFHIIKINNEEKIVTLKDKKKLLKKNKSIKNNNNNNYKTIK